MSILQRCPSYRESNKGSKERQGSTLGVHFTCVRLIESQIKGVKKGRDQLLVSVLQTCPSYRESNKESKESRDQLSESVLQRCPSYRESNKESKEKQGPTLGVHLIVMSVKRESTVMPHSQKLELPYLST